MSGQWEGRITVERWTEIQENAKEAARTAMRTGDTEGLTPLGRGYFQKYTQEMHNNIRVINSK